MNIEEYVLKKVKEKHKTCLVDQFDNGYFWAMKELQEFMHSKPYLDFDEWLGEITYLLPPSMSVHEARMLYERKIKDELSTEIGDKLKNEMV